MVDLTDQEAVEMTVRGDVQAFGVLVRRYQGPICRLLQRVVDSPVEAEDLAQEIFLEVYRSLPCLNDPRSFKPWLYRISWNKAVDWARSRKRSTKRGFLSLGSVDFTVVGPCLKTCDDRFADPEKQAIANDQIKVLAKALYDMPVHYRVVIHLKYVEGMSVGEIAEVLDVSPRTVETRLYRGKRLLRKGLERMGWHG